MSPSTRRAWIEIKYGIDPAKIVRPSPSTRRAWIEIHRSGSEGVIGRSPSTRRAWIEMETAKHYGVTPYVALHPEGVDRNSIVG